MKLNLKLTFIIAFCLFYFGTYAESTAQCGCMSSISVGTLSPNLGSSSTGTMRQGYLSLNLSGNYIFGNKYRSGWKEVPSQTVREFENSSIFFQSSYGITNRLSLDMDLGFIVRNYIDAPPFKYTTSGPNNLNILAKYNLYYNPRYDFEITVGGGLKVPLQMVSDTNYKYTQTSQGAFAGLYQIFLHKGFKKSDFHLFLIHRGDISARNDADYLYGPFFITSLIGTKPITKHFLALLEMKNELKMKDENPNEVNYDSGFMNLILAPQIMYITDLLNFGIKFEYPAIRHYNGSQAAKNYSVSLSLGINTKLF
jgi:hypothetical protein